MAKPSAKTGRAHLRLLTFEHAPVVERDWTIPVRRVNEVRRGSFQQLPTVSTCPHCGRVSRIHDSGVLCSDCLDEPAMRRTVRDVNVKLSLGQYAAYACGADGVIACIQGARIIDRKLYVQWRTTETPDKETWEAVDYRSVYIDRAV